MLTIGLSGFLRDRTATLLVMPITIPTWMLVSTEKIIFQIDNQSKKKYKTNVSDDLHSTQINCPSQA